MIRVDDPTELSRLLDVARNARAWCDAIEAYALEQLKAQVRVPNWSLVPTRPVRRWTDEHAALAETKALAIPAIDVFNTTLKSPAQMEKLLKRFKRDRDLWEHFAPLVESRSSGVKLARDNETPSEAFDPV